MIRRLLTYFLKRKAYKLSENLDVFKRVIEESRQKNGRVVIAFTGAPGSGKTTLVKRLIENEIEDLYIVDDLVDMYGNRLTKRDIESIANNFSGGIFVLSDYRSALYIKNPDLIIMIDTDEKKRKNNLSKRGSKKKLYKSFFYKYPPLSFSCIGKPIFLISGDS